MLQSVDMRNSAALNQTSGIDKATFELGANSETNKSQRLNYTTATTAPLVSNTPRNDQVPDFNEIRLPDQDGLMLPYEIDSSLVLPFNVAAQSVSENIILSMEQNPELNYVIFGESHSNTSNRFFYETASALSSNGVDLVVGIETPTTPEIDNLIRKFAAGEISEDQFLEHASQAIHESYLTAVFRRDDPLANHEGILTREYWQDRLRNDVVSYVDQGINVVFIDPGRFVEGANREVEMANALQSAAAQYPESLVFAQVGAMHAQPGYLPAVPEQKRGEGIWNEAVTSSMSGLEPAAVLLEESVGPNALQVYLGAQYFENNAGEPIYSVIDPFSMREADYNSVMDRYEAEGEQWHYGLPSELPGMGGGGYFIYNDPERYPEPKSRIME